ncbi:Asp-tRNA(Asn)/Glu-tRNA(Gln) amidotransferase subunit GatA [Phycisphaera mikurensis]|uniref:Glutamyl-tRNA(Gln) amidotransferase subunit A n=1 Tax=Phycisphaera mikurensis (strain NBRC 102666 / KCTC 22515 / FYK2301M01) TaxID=1142394 RepID=I0IET5_PHYMF|nr:Asp-tRNA(Asn)/Glu-tRNA(Gln) amidotransferase subunit GatA [Phycisphaera mikurensis]MBB6441568.1 aspartyl-tRNA(Asn)/glutamyl-tRNA(Gln) amidotransferase subunit A [Phycisphaera mikurensis]BAM03773.1 aspartyl/glutamyl-tRNA(Asn/Gln) amidotransferase subunit A [Phycisphaera mikurensis NBRC 102666]
MMTQDATPPDAAPADSVIGLRDAIAAGASAREGVAALLGRIGAANPELNAYREVYAEAALARAEAVDRGERSGPLAGVPIASKDVLCYDGGTTACGSRMLRGHRSPFSATCLARLEAAGAIVVGTCNMDEFALGSSTETSAYGPSLNPWDTARVPGGSSGGSAVALAAGLCSAALGTDTGGSIRQPAALCGVVGLKPTYGRISRHGLVACASSLDQVGPFTRTVADAALLLSVMAGDDPLDATTAPLPVEPELADAEAIHRPIRGLRVGLPRQYLDAEANHPAVQRAVERAMGWFRDAGAELVEVDLPHSRFGIPTYYVLMTAEVSSNLARYDGVHFGHRSPERTSGLDAMTRDSRGEAFGDEVKRRIMLGTYALSSGYHDALYERALRVRRLIANDFHRVFGTGGFEPPAASGGGCDVLLCPTTTGTAFKLGEKTDDPLSMYLNDIYTVNANLAGIAGISVPTGLAPAEEDAPELPVGVQLIGPAFGELRLLRAAAMLEAARGPMPRPPARG